MRLFNTITISFIIGFIPVLLWLWYWLREDRTHPEPRILIFLTFVFGGLAVPLAGALQWFIAILIAGYGDIDIRSIFHTSYVYAIVILILGATCEEVLKYLAAYFAALRKKANDEPIDVMIYLITAALGFSAVENSLYILSSVHEGYLTTGILIGNTRFIGATLLHVASSALIGVFAAFSYYKNSKIKSHYLFTGFTFAIALHTIFNSFIIRQENFTLAGFTVVWLVIVAIILLFEKVKTIYKRN